MMQVRIGLTLLWLLLSSGGLLAAEAGQPVAQDPALAISTVELEQLLTGDSRDGVVLVDARPEVKYQQGHIPGALGIPKAALTGQLGQLPKEKLLVIYCGGLSCPLSGQSAEIAKGAGFEKVRVYYEGMPGWTAAGHYAEMELPQLQKLVGEASAPFLLLDARPKVKYQKGFIPGAVSLPKAEFARLKGLLPQDKQLPVIVYCGGYQCNLSHQEAELLLAEGYANVSVFAAGEPAWREAGLPLWGDAATGGVAALEKKDVAALPEAIGKEEFCRLQAAGKLQVVDVREPDDYARAHIAGAINVFEEDFIYKSKEAVAKLAAEGRVVLVCNTGSRSASAYYAILNESDYPNKRNLQYLDTQVTFNADGGFVVK